MMLVMVKYLFIKDNIACDGQSELVVDVCLCGCWLWCTRAADYNSSYIILFGVSIFILSTRRQTVI